MHRVASQSAYGAGFFSLSYGIWLSLFHTLLWLWLAARRLYTLLYPALSLDDVEKCLDAAPKQFSATSM